MSISDYYEANFSDEQAKNSHSFVNSNIDAIDAATSSTDSLLPSVNADRTQQQTKVTCPVSRRRNLMMYLKQASSDTKIALPHCSVVEDEKKIKITIKNSSSPLIARCLLMNSCPANSANDLIEVCNIVDLLCI